MISVDAPTGGVTLTRELPIPREAILRVSKLDIRRRFRAMGKEAILDAIIGSSPEAMKDWADATEIASDDPLVVAMLPELEKAGLTPLEIESLWE